MNHVKQKSLSRSFRPTSCSSFSSFPLRFSLSLALLFGSTHPLSAVAYTVNSTADTNTGVGVVGTLRYVMGLATGPGDTISFDPTVQGQTIILTSPLPAIVNTLTISGGTGVTINENNANAAFTINGGIPPTATIQNINIINPINPDTTVGAASTFALTNSQFTNLTTSGSTTLTTSTLNGTVIIPAAGSLILGSNSSITATVPISVAATGSLTSTNSTIIGSINDSGTTSLTNTPVSGTVTVATGASFTGSGASTIINSLTSSGTSNLNTDASVTNALSVLAGTTSLTTAADVTGSTTVASGATLTVDGAGSSLNTLSTSGTTTLTNSATLTGAATVQTGGVLNATSSSLAGSLTDNGTATLTNTPVSGNVTVSSTGTFTGSGAATIIGSLTNSGTSNLNTNASVTGALSVLAGTVNLASSADILGASTVSAGANLNVDGAGTTLDTLDTFGTTTLTNSASITDTATVETGGTLNATNSSLTSSLTDNGTATLTNTSVAGNVTVGPTGIFTGSGAGTTLSSLTSSGTTNLNTNASVTGVLSVLSNTTSLTTGAKALGASTVNLGANLTVDGAGSSLNTLDTFGTTTLTNNATLTGPAIVEVGGTLNATNAFLSSSLTDNGTATLTNTPVSGVVAVGPTGTFTGSGASTTLSSLISSGTSNLNTLASVTGNMSVLAGSTSLTTGADVLGASTVFAGATLNVDGATTTINTLDTFGTTNLSNGATITGSALVEPGGTLNATNSSLQSTLTDNGTANLTNTPVAGAVTVGSTGTFTGSSAGTILATSLTSSGTTNLNNAASVTGPLSVLAGTTTVQNGAFVTGATTVQTQAFLNVDAATINTLNTSGTTTLSNGGVIFSATIEPTGRLQGIGTILNTINNQGGVFSPGLNGAGTLNSGNYIQQGNGTFESVVTGTSSGLSSSATTAQLAGNLAVNILPTGNYSESQVYTIIQASTGVIGTFSSISLSTPSLFRIFYLPNQVNIQLFPIFAMGLSGNAASAADCFLSVPSTAGTNADRGIVYEDLFRLPVAQFQSAFNQFQPSQYTALNFVQLDNALNLQRSIFRHSALWKKRENFGGLPYCLPAVPTSNECCHGDLSCDSSTSRYNLGRSPCCLAPSAWHGWIDATGVWQQQSSTNEQYGYHDSSGLVSFGIDGTYEDVSIGLLGAYQIDRLNWEQDAGTAIMRTGYGGFYAMIYGNNYLVDISGLVGYTTYHADRNIRFSTIRRTASSTFNSYEGVAGIGIASYNTLCGIEWVPYARVDYAYLAQKAFSERRAESLRLSIRPYNTSLIQTEFGVFFERTCSWGYGLLTPKLSLSYIGRYAVAHKHLNAQFTDIPTCTFAVDGWNFGRNLFAPTFALTFFRAGSQLALELGYTAQVGHRYWNQQGYLSVDWKF